MPSLDTGMAWPLVWIALAWLLVVVASWLLETALTPRPQSVRQRQSTVPATNLVHIMLLGALLALLLALTARPWLSAALVLSLVLLVVLVNQDKYRQLREPFLACDFIYFWDVIRHPKLYLPFFGYGKAAGLLVAFLTALAIWLWLEPTVYDSAGLHLASLVFSALLAWLGFKLAKQALTNQLTHDPDTDLMHLGLVAFVTAQKAAQSTWLQALHSPQPAHSPQDGAKGSAQGSATSPTPTTSPATPNPTSPSSSVSGAVGTTHTALPTPFLHLRPASVAAQLPDIVCIQAESFVDMRRNYPEQVDSEIYKHWDDVCRAGWQHGQLQVPAWGANTVRSEFAFLSGLTPDQLGVHRFQPYDLIGQTPASLWGGSLPARLKAMGFQTTFMHPYARHFYNRHRILPKLGFDTFVDIKAFANAPKHGYLTDPLLGQAIVNRLAKPDRSVDQPMFVHVVTMQGHGPYDGHGKDAKRLLDGYLHCMRSTDQMVGQLIDQLSARDRPTVVCVFGDHVPILPSVYAAHGLPDGRTDYVIWRGGPDSDHRQTDLGVGRLPLCELPLSELGLAVTTAAGLTTDQGTSPQGSSDG